MREETKSILTKLQKIKKVSKCCGASIVFSNSTGDYVCNICKTRISGIRGK